MSLSAKQISFVNEQAKGKTKKEILDMVGFLYKDNIRRFIRKKRRPQSIKDILHKENE